MAALALKGKKPEKEMSFLEHLEELRWHIIRSVIAIVVLMIVAFSCRELITDIIILSPQRPEFITSRLLCQLGELVNSDVLCINQNPVELINFRMAGQLTTSIVISLVAGLILAFPVVLWEFWKFFKPALKPNESKYAQGAVFVSSMLFFMGVLFGYFLIAPLSIHFLTTWVVSSEVTNTIDIRSYIGNVTSICLATGVMFELPIVAFFLAKTGILTPQFMKTYRRHAIVVIMIVSAIITPPDVFSLILVTIPLLFLYEISIFICARVVKKKENEREAFMNDEISTDTSIVPSKP